MYIFTPMFIDFIMSRKFIFIPTYLSHNNILGCHIDNSIFKLYRTIDCTILDSMFITA